MARSLIRPSGTFSRKREKEAIFLLPPAGEGGAQRRMRAPPYRGQPLMRSQRWISATARRWFAESGTSSTSS